MPSAQRALTRADVARYAAEECFHPSHEHLVGLELEFLTFPRRDNTQRVDLDALVEATSAPLPRRGRVTFEPGGQLELSTKPQADAVAAIAAAQVDLAELERRVASIDVELRAVGYDRWRPPRRLVDTPRYEVMERWFDNAGSAGRRMMTNTAALQVNVDFGPTHLERRWRAAHAIGPVLVAAFANSPAGPWKSARMASWFAIDRTRTSPVLTDNRTDPAAAYADYALGAQALLWSGGAIPGSPQPFAHWLEHGNTLGHPDRADLAYHLTTLFPPVRPRGWLELRYLDALPSPWWEAAATTAVTLLSDDAVEAALRAAAPVAGRWRDAARDGLDDDALAAAADACFALAVDVSGDAGVEEYRTRYVGRREPAWA